MTPLIEQQLEAFFRAHRPPTSVADIGAGHDAKVGEALDRVEPPDPPHAGGSARLDRYDLDDLDICVETTPKTYDTVVCCDLLEHVRFPLAAARCIYDAVRPWSELRKTAALPESAGSQQVGWLYVTTVFAFEHHEYPEDWWRFTTTALTHLFSRGDLQPYPGPALKVERCWYEEESPHPDFGRRWRVSLVGQRV